MLIEVDLSDYTGFVVTGKYRNGKNFPGIHYDASPSGFYTAMGINLHCGNVWGVKKSDGKRKLLKSVYN